jgi:hypothetical protein
MKRADILDDAKQKVTVDRAKDHGDLEKNFRTIAQYWSVHLEVEVSPVDVGIMMSLLKVARMKGNQAHEDNYSDGCGYLACAGELK